MRVQAIRIDALVRPEVGPQRDGSEGSGGRAHEVEDLRRAGQCVAHGCRGGNDKRGGKTRPSDERDAIRAVSYSEARLCHSVSH